MIYINNNNIYKKYESCSCIKSETIINDTEYLPLRAYNNVLLMSDGKLYIFTNDRKLFLIKMNQGYDYVVDDPNNFTNLFVKINSKYYEIYEKMLYEIPVIANNCDNIYITYTNNSHYYYYVNINNELMFLDTCNQSKLSIILDDDVNSILYVSSRDKHIIYVKNDIIIYSKIINLTQLTNSYAIDYIGGPIIKASGEFILDSYNNLYTLTCVNGKYDTKKISERAIDFYHGFCYVHITKTENKIYSISTFDYNENYIDIGHFGKKYSNTKSANNVHKKT